MATAELFYKIVNSTNAHSDNEHIRIYVDSNTSIPDRTAAILYGGKDPFPAMRESLQKLISCGADCIVIPCNTAYYYIDRLQNESAVPILNMPNITAAECARRFPGAKAGILATDGTLTAEIYQKALGSAGVDYVLPEKNEQEALMRVIYDGVKAGKEPESYRQDMELAINGMTKRGADVFILGCTELPIAENKLKLQMPYVDSLDELARATVKYCCAELK